MQRLNYSEFPAHKAQHEYYIGKFNDAVDPFVRLANPQL